MKYIVEKKFEDYYAHIFKMSILFRDKPFTQLFRLFSLCDLVRHIYIFQLFL